MRTNSASVAQLARRHPQACGEVAAAQGPDGRLERPLDLSHKRDPDLPRRRARRWYSKTGRTVFDHMEEFRTDLKAGLGSTGKQMAMSGRLYYWLQHLITPNKEPSTYDVDEVPMRRHITPLQSDLLPAEPREEHLERWSDELECAGVRWHPRQSALSWPRTLRAKSAAYKHHCYRRSAALDLEGFPAMIVIAAVPADEGPIIDAIQAVCNGAVGIYLLWPRRPVGSKTPAALSGAYGWTHFGGIRWRHEFPVASPRLIDRTFSSQNSAMTRLRNPDD